MLVDGQEYGNNVPVKTPEEKSRMPVFIIIVACVVSFVVILIIVIVVYCLYRRRQNLGKINPSPPSTPDEIYEDSEVKLPSRKRHQENSDECEPIQVFLTRAKWQCL